MTGLPRLRAGCKTKEEIKGRETFLSSEQPTDSLLPSSRLLSCRLLVSFRALTPCLLTCWKQWLNLSVAAGQPRGGKKGCCTVIYRVHVHLSLKKDNVFFGLFCPFLPRHRGEAGGEGGVAEKRGANGVRKRVCDIVERPCGGGWGEETKKEGEEEGKKRKKGKASMVGPRCTMVVLRRKTK